MLVMATVQLNMFMAYIAIFAVDPLSFLPSLSMVACEPCPVLGGTIGSFLFTISSYYTGCSLRDSPTGTSDYTILSLFGTREVLAMLSMGMVFFSFTDVSFVAFTTDNTRLPFSVGPAILLRWLHSMEYIVGLYVGKGVSTL